jgi:sulfatase maturation enzyme AslB (radical SAM superfamily)
MSHLSVEYFGGEPLLADKIVFDLADTFWSSKRSFVNLCKYSQQSFALNSKTH